MSRWVDGLAAGMVAGAPLLAAALMFGLSEAGTVSVSVASIAAISSALSAWLANRSRRDVRERIGTPNGHGNVVQMMERLLSGKTAQDTRLAGHDSTIAAVIAQVSELAASVVELTAIVDQVRTDCVGIRAGEDRIESRVAEIARHTDTGRRRSD